MRSGKPSRRGAGFCPSTNSHLKIPVLAAARRSNAAKFTAVPLPGRTSSVISHKRNHSFVNFCCRTKFNLYFIVFHRFSVRARCPHSLREIVEPQGCHWCALSPIYKRPADARVCVWRRRESPVNRSLVDFRENTGNLACPRNRAGAISGIERPLHLLSAPMNDVRAIMQQR